MPIGDRDRDEIRRIVMAEVAQQMQPVNELLTKMHDWQLSWWSNGSGRPPGFFQLRMAEDDKRNKIVEDFVKTAQTRQIESENDQKRKERRWKFWWPIVKWVGSGIGAALLLFVTWAAPFVYQFAHDVTGIVQEWHEVHKTQLRPKSMFNAPDPVVSSTHQPQDANLPPGYVTQESH